MTAGTTPTIHNGTAMSRTGHRVLAFTHALDLQPVLYAVYSGYQTQRGTVQICPENSILFRCDWSSREEDCTIWIEGDRLSDVDALPWWQRLRAMHPWADEFLSPTGRGPSFIPEDVVPRDQYLSVRGKRKRLEKFIRRFGLPMEAETFLRESKNDLRVEPRPLDFAPEDYLPYEETVIGSAVGIHRDEWWWQSHGNGTPAVPMDLEDRKERAWRSNYAHDEPSQKDGQRGLPGWDQAPFLVRMVRGCRTREHHSHGKSLDVWMTKGRP